MSDTNDRTHLNVSANESAGITAGPNTTGSPSGGAAIPDGVTINGIGQKPYPSLRGKDQAEALGGRAYNEQDPTLKHMADDLPRQGNAGMPGGFLDHDSEEQDDAEMVSVGASDR